MNRIEYLINNPNEIDIIDLDLLNNEIEKYPYFYSLRALKLLALKKSDHQDFEKELEITSSFNNTQNLFNLLNNSTNQELIIEELEEEIEAESLIETQEILIEEDVIIETESLVEQNNIDEVAIEESIENSIKITQDFLQTDEIIINAVEQTIDVLQETEMFKEINQVELIDRNIETEKEIKISENRPVSNSTPFQILNTKDEVVRNHETRNEKILIKENIIKKSEFIEEIVNNENAVITENENNDTEILIQETIDEKVSLKVEENNSYSFNEWLQLQSSNSLDSQKEHKYQVIEDFLEKNPKITPLKKQEIPEYKNEVKDLKRTDFSDLMTETLAQIYIEQKQYEKAIKAYKILILKYPEKNSLFANQIKVIENLKNSK